MLAATATCALAFFAFCAPGSASALDLGPDSVPPVNVVVTVPPVVAVGSVTIPTGNVAPGLGAAVTVSPADGVGVGVTLPTSVGPVPLPTGTPDSVHVGVGTGGVSVDAPVVGVTGPGIPQPASPPIAGVPQPPAPVAGSSPPTAANASTVGSASTRDAARSGTRSSPGSVEPATGGARQPVIGGLPAARISGAPGEQPLGPVNASLRHSTPERSSTLWRAIDAIASRQGLLLALLAIVLVGRIAAAGLLRDALRRTSSAGARSVSAN